MLEVARSVLRAHLGSAIAPLLKGRSRPKSVSADAERRVIEKQLHQHSRITPRSWARLAFPRESLP